MFNHVSSSFLAFNSMRFFSIVKDHSQDLVAAGLAPCMSECTEAQMKVTRGDSGDLGSTKMWRERWKDKQKHRKGD